MPDVYTHYKGGRYYLVNDNITLEATGERYVVYQSVTTSKYFTRPYIEFVEKFSKE